MKAKSIQGNALRQKGCIAFLLAVSALWAGCSESTSKPPEATEAVSASPTFQTLQATLTPTFTAIPSATATRAVGSKTKCVEISPNVPQALTGVIVLDGQSYYASSYMLELNSNRQTLLFQYDPWTFSSLAVSPDGEWLAYRKYSQLILTKANGKNKSYFSIGDPLRWIVGWLDNKRLLIDQKGDPIDSLLVYDPFSGQRKLLSPDYPGIYDTYPLEELWGPTVYDPTLTRVIYSRATSQGDLLTVLWNREAKQDIVLLEGRPIYDIPQWSPDGRQFAIVKSKSESEDPDSVDQEIFTVSRDGDIKQLTHLTDFYSKAEIYSSSWSPDGRYIAFWLGVEPETFPDLYPDVPPDLLNPLQRLAVVDTVTQEVTNYCIPGSQTFLAPLWSPDSQGILLENLYDISSPRKSHVYVVDLEQGLAFHITDNMEPVGWMKPSP